MDKTISSLSASSLPFITDDYHLIISSEEFDQYRQKNKKKRWILLISLFLAVGVIASVSLFVVPLFLQAHLTGHSDGAESSSHASVAPQVSTQILIDDISKHTFMPAVYGE